MSDHAFSDMPNDLDFGPDLGFGSREDVYVADPGSDSHQDAGGAGNGSGPGQSHGTVNPKPGSGRINEIRSRSKKGESAKGGSKNKEVTTQQSVPAQELGAGKLGNLALEAERIIVGLSMTNREAYEYASEKLRATDFFGFQTRVAWEAVSQVMDGLVMEVPSPEPLLIASIPEVAAVASVDDLKGWCAASEPIASIEPYVELVLRACQERALGGQVLRAQEIWAGDGSLEEKSTQIRGLIEEAPESRKMPTVQIGAAALVALSKMAKDAKDGVTSGVSYGFDDLDALTAGLHPGQVIVLAARPAMGKTALALAIAKAVAEISGKPVLFASMEMKAEELSKRLISIESGVDGQSMRTLALDEADWEAMLDATERLASLPLEVIDVPQQDLHSICAIARKKKKQTDLSLLVVDYLQIMSIVGSRAANREQQIAEITRGLKTLAMQLGIPILLLSQLSRAVESRGDKRPTLSDLRESGAIEQDADVVMFIHRDEVYDKNTPNKGTATVIVGKQRSGPIGDVTLGYISKNTRFINRSNSEIEMATNAYKGQP